MKNPLGQRWIILCLIWGVVLLLTYWNQVMIRTINRQRADFEISGMTAAFVQKNRHEIDRMVEKRAAYRQPVESIQIGSLSLKNQLRSLASTHNLMILAMNTDIDQAVSVSDKVSMNLTVVGTYADALGWLAALERDYTYARALRIKVQRSQGRQVPQFEIQIEYQFELLEPQMAGEGVATPDSSERTE